MERGLSFILILVLVLGFVNASCNSGQIDINSASVNELDKLNHVGLTVAEYIVEARPFNSLDDLSEVKWLGSRKSYIEDIKSQGLACVEEYEETSSKTSYNNEESKKTSKNSSENYIEFVPFETTGNAIKENKENNVVVRETIVLGSHEGNTKDIKMKENLENKNINYPLIGLIAFSGLIGTLMLFKRKRYKNEFKE